MQKQTTKPIAKWTLIAGLFMTALLACAVGLWWRLRSQPVFTDADTIRTPAALVAPRDVLWQPPSPVTDLVNSGAQTYEPRLSWDGLTLYFVRGKAGENADIFSATRTPTGWTEAARLDQLDSEYDDLGPEPSADGQRLYFYSDRPGGSGGYDIWLSERGEDGWRSPINLGPRVNSEFNDYGPALAPDGKSLCFASNRPQRIDSRQPDPHAWPATVREDLFHRTYDLYRSELFDSGPSAAEPIAALNTPFNEAAPAFSPVGDFVYFASDRPGGLGGFDLYRARNRQGQLQPPENLGPPINTAASELDPGLTQLGYGLYFSSNRPDVGPNRVVRASPPVPEANRVLQASPPVPTTNRVVGASPPVSESEGADQPGYRIYYTASREVFSEEQPSAAIDWSALAALAPNLLYLLLALLLVLLLLGLMRDIKNRQFSLLTRCLLASLLVHSLLMLAFTFWRVSKGVAGLVRGSGATRVSLVSSGAGGGDALYAQIRGALTDPAPPSAIPALDLARPTVVLPSTADVPPATMKVARTTIEAPTSLAELQPRSNPTEAPLALQPPDAVNVVFASLAGHAFATPSADVAEPSSEPPAPVATPIRNTAERPPAVAAWRPGTGMNAVALDVPRSADVGEIASVAEPPSAPADSAAVSARIDPFAATHLPPGLARAFEPLLAIAIPGSASESSAGTNATESSPSVAPVAHERARGPLAYAASQPTRASALAVLSTASIGATGGEAAPRPDFAAAAAATAGNFQPREATPSSTVAVHPTPGPVALNSASPAHRDLSLALPADSGAIDGTAKSTEAPSEPVAAITPLAPGTFDARRKPLALPAAANSTAPALVDVSPDRSAAAAQSAAVTSLFELDSTPRAPGGVADQAAMLGGAPSLSNVGGPLSGSDFALALPSEGAGLAVGVARSSGTPLVRDAGASPDASDLEPIGVLRGLVTSAVSGAPLAGAVVRLDLAGHAPLTAKTDESGLFQLPVPEAPEFFAVSVTSDGFVPAAANISGEDMRGAAVRKDFALLPISDAVVALEKDPAVHHLGNDRFQGRINSQFQRDSEGLDITIEFDLNEAQTAPFVSRAAFVLLAKGVQCPHPVYLNGRRLAARFTVTPDDGSFGKVVFRIPPHLLLAGKNALQIQDLECTGDHDDFEFINPLLVLTAATDARGDSETQ